MVREFEAEPVRRPWRSSVGRWTCEGGQSEDDFRAGDTGSLLCNRLKLICIESVLIYRVSVIEFRLFSKVRLLPKCCSRKRELNSMVSLQIDH